MKNFLVELTYLTAEGAERRASIETQGKTNHEAHFKAVERVRNDGRRRLRRLLESTSYSLEPVLHLKHG